MNAQNEYILTALRRAQLCCDLLERDGHTVLSVEVGSGLPVIRIQRRERWREFADAREEWQVYSCRVCCHDRPLTQHQPSLPAAGRTHSRRLL